MKVMFIKTGKYSFDPVYGPIIDCIRGRKREISDTQAQQLISSNWAMEYKKSEEIFEYENEEDKEMDAEKETEEESKGVEEKTQYPWLEDDWDYDSPHAKDKLEVWSLENLGMSLDKRRTVYTLIEVIKDMVEENDR